MSEPYIQGRVPSENTAAGERQQKSLPPRVWAILSEVAIERQVSVDEILGRSATQRVSSARGDAAYRLRSLTPRPSLPRIGRWLGRDHSSVFYAIKKHVERMAAA